MQDDASGEELTVQLDIQSLKDFHPDQLVEHVPELKKLMELRDALVSLKGPLGNAPSFRKAIESVLDDADAREHVLKELGLAARPTTDA
ncbi:hypothetical protein D3C76_1707660 [compost metagenome]